jgi:hypothetical protein
MSGAASLSPACCPHAPGRLPTPAETLAHAVQVVAEAPRGAVARATLWGCRRVILTTSANLDRESALEHLRQAAAARGVSPAEFASIAASAAEIAVFA